MNSTNIHINNVHIAVVKRPPKQPIMPLAGNDFEKKPEPKPFTSWTFTPQAELLFLIYKVGQPLKNKPLYFQLVDDSQKKQVSLIKFDEIPYTKNGGDEVPPTRLNFPPVTINKPGAFHYTMSQVPPSDGSSYDDRKYAVIVKTDAKGQIPYVDYQAGFPPRFQYTNVPWSTESISYNADDDVPIFPPSPSFFADAIIPEAHFPNLFTVAIEDEDGRILAKTSNGHRGVVKFPCIHAAKTGVNTYKMYQTNKTDNNWKIDDRVLTFHVNVTDPNDIYVYPDNPLLEFHNENLNSVNIFK